MAKNAVKHTTTHCVRDAGAGGSNPLTPTNLINDLAGTAAEATGPSVPDVPRKPLGHRAYGSIPHLPGSRLGPADHHCHHGQEAICWTKARDRHDRIIVTEKLDGSCCAIANIGGEIVALGRAGFPSATSPYKQHHIFDAWVRANRDRFLAALIPGERVVGEWLAQAHSTRYRLQHDPFVVFDLMAGQRRLPHDQCRAATARADIPAAHVIHDGGPMHLDLIHGYLDMSAHGGIGPAEGAVWRVERRGVFDFLAKWVRPEKVDGSLLPEISGGDPVWNWTMDGPV